MSFLEGKGLILSLTIVGILALVVVGGFVIRGRQARGRVSELGKYNGYTENVYDGTKRVSDYLTMPDGTRLAYDLFLPAKKGAVADAPLPVLFKYTPYLRTFTIFDKNGKSTFSDLEALAWYESAMVRIRYWLVPRLGTVWMRSSGRSGWAAW